MKQLCDLHTHSAFSDGSFTPAEIIDEAIRIGLSAVALCDHNTVDGLPDFLVAAKGKSIEAVPGTEISVDYNGHEMHLLALYIPENAYVTLESTSGKLLSFSTEELEPKTTRGTQGVQVMRMKKGHTLSGMTLATEETMQYKSRNIPSGGYYPQSDAAEEDDGQISLF